MTAFFATRLVEADYYIAPPVCGLDPVHSEFRGADVQRVPILRIFGSTPAGQKSCLHVHGVFPYIMVPCSALASPESVIHSLANNLDKAINISLASSNSNTQHVFSIKVVSGIPFYGYHNKEVLFYKIFFYNPSMVKRACDLLQNGDVLGQIFQPHQAHIPFVLQFFIDYNLHGMNFIHLSKVFFRRERNSSDNLFDCSEVQLDTCSQLSQKIWDVAALPETALMPLHVERMSSCELEADASATDILNKNAVTDNAPVNPGLEGLWADERQRRREEGRSSQITVTSSQERVEYEQSEAEKLLRLRLREILAVEDANESSPSLLQTPDNSACQLASQLDNHSSVNNVTSQDLSQDRSQAFLDSQDLELAGLLDALAEGEPAADQDSVLGSQPLCDEESNEEEETLEMSQCVVQTDTKSPNDSDEWNNSFWEQVGRDAIPQVDGATDDIELIICDDSSNHNGPQYSKYLPEDARNRESIVRPADPFLSDHNAAAEDQDEVEEMDPDFHPLDYVELSMEENPYVLPLVELIADDIPRLSTAILPAVPDEPHLVSLWNSINRGNPPTSLEQIVGPLQLSPPSQNAHVPADTCIDIENENVALTMAEEESEVTNEQQYRKKYRKCLRDTVAEDCINIMRQNFSRIINPTVICEASRSAVVDIPSIPAVHIFTEPTGTEPRSIETPYDLVTVDSAISDAELEYMMSCTVSLERLNTNTGSCLHSAQSHRCDPNEHQYFNDGNSLETLNQYSHDASSAMQTSEIVKRPVGIPRKKRKLNEVESLDQDCYSTSVAPEQECSELPQSAADQSKKTEKFCQKENLHSQVSTSDQTSTRATSPYIVLRQIQDKGSGHSHENNTSNCSAEFSIHHSHNDHDHQSKISELMNSNEQNSNTADKRLVTRRKRKWPFVGTIDETVSSTDPAGLQEVSDVHGTKENCFPNNVDNASFILKEEQNAVHDVEKHKSKLLEHPFGTKSRDSTLSSEVAEMEVKNGSGTNKNSVPYYRKETSGFSNSCASSMKEENQTPNIVSTVAAENVSNSRHEVPDVQWKKRKSEYQIKDCSVIVEDCWCPKQFLSSDRCRKKILRKRKSVNKEFQKFQTTYHLKECSVILPHMPEMNQVIQTRNKVPRKKQGSTIPIVDGAENSSSDESLDSSPSLPTSPSKSIKRSYRQLHVIVKKSPIKMSKLHNVPVKKQEVHTSPAKQPGNHNALEMESSKQCVSPPFSRSKRHRKHSDQNENSFDSITCSSPRTNTVERSSPPCGFSPGQKPDNSTDNGDNTGKCDIASFYEFLSEGDVTLSQIPVQSDISKIVLVPNVHPPSKEKIALWIRAKKILKTDSEEQAKKPVISVKKGQQIHSTPSHSNKKSIVSPPNFTPIHPLKHVSRRRLSLETIDEELNDKRHRRNSEGSEASLRKHLLDSQFRQQFRSPASPRLNNSQIDGPTLNDTYGFRAAQQNLQDARAVHEFQYVTSLFMEVHVCTRADLCPNPENDQICAIIYAILDDVPDDGNHQRECTGAIMIASSGSYSNTALNIEYVDDESALLNATVSLVRKWDPDILVGYEVQMLSWGYLIQRAAYLGVSITPMLSRVPDSLITWERMREAEDTSELRITGRIMLDLWRVMRHEVTTQSYTFENVTFHLLHQRIPFYTFQNLTHWWNRDNQFRERVIEHYVTRVCGCRQLLKELDFIGRTSELARLFGIQFYEVLSRGSQFRVESMMLRLTSPMNYVAVTPSIHQRARMKAPEIVQLIMEPESKFYEDPVIVLDFQSLYPSIIIAYNYCYSTCVGRVKHLGKKDSFEFGCVQLQVSNRVLQKVGGSDGLVISPCGVAYVPSSVRRGILPRMLEDILNTRLMVKKTMKEHKNDSCLQKVLHSRQLGLKLIANVTYGYTAANFSGRMPCIEIADSIVSKGRETLERAIRLVESNPKWDAHVVYGDTDSMFVLLKGRSKAEAFKIGEEMAEAVTKENPKPVKLKFEKVYMPCILQTKKRYVGYMYETPDQKDPVYDAKGIETVRRDGCPAVAKILEKTLKILFETKDSSVVRSYVERQFQKIMQGRVSLQEYIFAKEYRGLNGYKPGACVPALEIARNLLRSDPRAEPRVKERVPYVVVYGSPNLPVIRLVRRPEEVLTNPSLRLNAIYYITRAIIPPLHRCLDLLGLDVMKWYEDMPRTKYLAWRGGQPAERSPTKGQGTLSQYFACISCAICHRPSQTGLCTDCQLKPQTSAIGLSLLIHENERSLSHFNQICMNCTGVFCPDNIHCVSLDCPVLYRRIQANRDCSHNNNLRDLRGSLETMEF